MNSAPPSGALSTAIVAAVQRHELVHDREPEAGAGLAAAAVAERAEALEEAVALVGRDADAAVGHLEARVVAVADEGAADRAAHRGEPQRVREQVGDHAADALGVEVRRQLLGRLDREAHLALGGQRLELGGDHAHGERQVVVGELELRLGVVAPDLLEHAVHLLERVEGGEPDALQLLARLRVAALAADALLARQHDLQRRAQVVAELAQQSLAVVVDLRQPRRQGRQLGVLGGDPLLGTLAVGDRPALGHDQRDPPVAGAQRAQAEVERPGRGPAALDQHVGVEAGEPTLGGGRHRLLELTARGRARPPPRRLPQRPPDHLGAVDAAGGQGRRRDVDHPAVGLQQRDEARRLGERNLRHQPAREGIVLRIGHDAEAPAKRFQRLHRRSPWVETSACHVRFRSDRPRGGPAGSEPSERLAAYRHRRRRHREHSSNFRGSRPRGRLP